MLSDGSEAVFGRLRGWADGSLRHGFSAPPPSVSNVISSRIPNFRENKNRAHRGMQCALCRVCYYLIRQTSAPNHSASMAAMVPSAASSEMASSMAPISM